MGVSENVLVWTTGEPQFFICLLQSFQSSSYWSVDTPHPSSFGVLTPYLEDPVNLLVFLGVGDVDGDGYDDFWLTSTSHGYGKAYLMYGSE